MIKTTYIRARATELEKEKYNQLASELGVSLSEYNHGRYIKR